MTDAELENMRTRGTPLERKAADEIERLRAIADTTDIMTEQAIKRQKDEIEQWRKLNSERVDEIAGLIHRLREAANETKRLRADNLKLVAIIARNETHYEAAMAMSEKHRTDAKRLREIIGNLLKIAPRPWMDGGASWAKWDAAMTAAEAVADEKTE